MLVPPRPVPVGSPPWIIKSGMLSVQGDVSAATCMVLAHPPVPRSHAVEERAIVVSPAGQLRKVLARRWRMLPVQLERDGPLRRLQPHMRGLIIHGGCARRWMTARSLAALCATSSRGRSCEKNAPDETSSMACLATGLMQCACSHCPDFHLELDGLCVDCAAALYVPSTPPSIHPIMPGTLRLGSIAPDFTAETTQ